VEQNGTLATCRKLGIALVAYSPLGRGFLTGAITRPEDFEEGDFRRTNPRFQGDNFARNLQLVKQVETLAAEKGCTPAQLALAWVLAQGQDIVPIPGTRRRARLDENIGALDVQLDKDELASIDRIFPPEAVAGARYAPAAMTHIGR
jgi:aryl-alcohol dehydrogenase-like predicted oxidoreductase